MSEVLATIEYMKEFAKKVGVEGGRLAQVVMGKGEQVKFQRDVEAYLKTHPRKKEKEAQKAVFQERLKGVQEEIRLSGKLAPDSKEYSAFLGALKEICGPELGKQLKKDASDPTLSSRWSSPPSAPVTPGDVRRQTAHYQAYLGKTLQGVNAARIDTHLKGKSVVLGDCVQNTRLVGSLAERFSKHPDIFISGDIQATLKSNPALRMELGKLLFAKEQLERHEKMFKKELHHETALEKLKEEARETLTIMVWKAPVDWLKSIGASAFRPSVPSTIAMFGATAGFLTKEVVSGSKLLIRAAQTLGTYAGTKL